MTNQEYTDKLKGYLIRNGIVIKDKPLDVEGETIVDTIMDRSMFEQFPRVNYDAINFHLEYFGNELAAKVPSPLAITSVDFPTAPMIVSGKRVQRIRVVFKYTS